MAIDAETYQEFKKTMLSNGKIYWVANPLNEKESLKNNVYRESERGLVPYPKAYTDALNVIDGLDEEIKSNGDREALYSRFINECRIEDVLNQNSDYYIVTPNGQAVDLETLSSIMKAGKDPDEARTDWVMRVTEPKYADCFITLRTGKGVNYPIRPNIPKGRRLLEMFFRYTLCVNDEAMFRNAFSWITSFLGRLLIGGNARKEFVVFAGEKDSGKTTLMQLLKEILGTYAGLISDDILYKNESNDTRRALYKASSKRLIIHSEGSTKNKVNTQSLKKITGGSSIPLIEGKGPDFIVNGKIAEDSNYIPVPDNAKDEAFNDRLVIIPFRKNAFVHRSDIDALIKALHDSKEDIFAFMVSEAARSLGSRQPQTEHPECSKIAKKVLSVIRDPVKAFYEEVCGESYENDYHLAKEVFQTYNDWRSTISERVKAFPYLRSELPIETMSETQFNKEMKNLHFHVKEHTRSGFMYTHMRLRTERLHWGRMLDFKEDPQNKTKLHALKTMEQTEKMARTVTNPDIYQQNINEELARRNKAAQDDFMRPSSGRVETGMYLAAGPVFDPRMLAGLHDQHQRNEEKRRQKEAAEQEEFKKNAFPRAKFNFDDEEEEEPEQKKAAAGDTYPAADYATLTGGRVFQSYSTPVTPFDLPEEGDKKPDDFVTPFDLEETPEG